MPGGRGPDSDRRIDPGDRRLLLFGGLFSILALVAGTLIVLGAAFGVPVSAAEDPAAVAMATPAFATPGLTPAAPGDILPVLATRTATAAVQATVASQPATASPVATPSARPASPVALPRAGFVISPQVGPPGTEITVAGQEWAPSDLVAIRLQDPANPQVSSEELPLATADSRGSFSATFTIPPAPPWANLPAVLLWVVSSKTGIYSASPQPFVMVTQALQPPLGPAAANLAQPTAVTVTTPSPTALAGASQSPLPTPSNQSPTPAPATAESPTPPPTVALLPTAGAEPLVAATPATTPAAPSLTPSPSPTYQPSPTATEAAGTAPRGLPRAGGSVLAAASVTWDDVALRAGPGSGDRVVLYLPQGSTLAVMGQTPAGDWLWVSTDEGARGWVPRSSTDF